ncbi:hypothetical protein [Micromonospora sp. NPDC050200]|uniref:hypothetical protein n=1 Tax=Micromonospora sp. NPDC050200 TaxID=3155664 RepID=UPI0033D48910
MTAPPAHHPAKPVTRQHPRGDSPATLHLVRKYTGHDFTEDALAAARQGPGALPVLAAAIADTCHALTATEADLARCADTIAGHLAHVHRALTAGPGEPAPTINPIGCCKPTDPATTP